MENYYSLRGSFNIQLKGSILTITKRHKGLISLLRLSENRIYDNTSSTVLDWCPKLKQRTERAIKVLLPFATSYLCETKF
jgi:hypothetical protein